jgi:hypothetical protein
MDLACMVVGTLGTAVRGRSVVGLCAALPSAEVVPEDLAEVDDGLRVDLAGPTLGHP